MGESFFLEVEEWCGVELYLSVHTGGSGGLWGMFVCMRTQFLADMKEGKIKRKDEAYKEEGVGRGRKRCW